MLIQRLFYINDIDQDKFNLKQTNPAKWPMPPGVRVCKWCHDSYKQRTMLQIEYDEQMLMPPEFKTIGKSLELEDVIDVEFTVVQGKS